MERNQDQCNEQVMTPNAGSCPTRVTVKTEIEHRIKRLRAEADNLEEMLKYLPPAMLESEAATSGLFSLLYPNRY